MCLWIERDNPEAASRVGTVIHKGCSKLRDSQNKGDALEISRIFHGAQHWPLTFIAAS